MIWLILSIALCLIALCLALIACVNPNRQKLFMSLTAIAFFAAVALQVTQPAAAARDEARELIKQEFANLKKTPDLNALEELAKREGTTVESLLADLEDGSLFDQGLAALAEGAYKDAARFFRYSAEEDEKNAAEGFLYEGHAFYLSKDYEKAAKAYGRSAEGAPDFFNAWLCWGLVLNLLDRHKEACARFKEAVYLRPGSAESYNNWGASLASLGSYEKACDKYKRAIKLQPDNVMTWRNWGLALANLGSYREASAKYQQAARLEPKNAGNWFNWGTMLLYLGKYNESCAKYEQATQIQPENADAWYNWSVALKAMGKEKEANEKSKKAKELE